MAPPIIELYHITRTYRMGDVEVRAFEPDVPGDEKVARADDTSPGGGMAAFANIGRRTFAGETTDILEIAAFRGSGGVFVKEDRQAKALPKLPTEGAGEVDAFRHGDER